MQGSSVASEQYYGDMCSHCKGEMITFRNDKRKRHNILSLFTAVETNVWHTTYVPEYVADRFANMEDRQE
jgi:hypothetical protein